jgi:hypothetical protein
MKNERKMFEGLFTGYEYRNDQTTGFSVQDTAGTEMDFYFLYPTHPDSNLPIDFGTPVMVTYIKVMNQRVPTHIQTGTYLFVPDKLVEFDTEL